MSSRVLCRVPHSVVSSAADVRLGCFPGHGLQRKQLKAHCTTEQHAGAANQQWFDSRERAISTVERAVDGTA